ncbi:EAL domain-containing protein [Roseibium sp.]|uniref:EAL domain-containing protein n=1 Tax=Roseibium sp. TaxID=1936156 RepID=UPI003D0E3B54
MTLRPGYSRYIPPMVVIAFAFALSLSTVELLQKKHDAEAKDDALHALITSSSLLNTHRLESLLTSALYNSDFEYQARVTRAFVRFQNALNSWHVNPLLELGPQASLITRRLADAKEMSGSIEPLISNLEDRNSIEQALAKVHQIGAALNQVRHLAENRMSAIARESTETLERQAQIQAFVGAGLISSLGIWVFLLVRRLRHLANERKRAGFNLARATAELKHDPATGLMTQKVLIEKIEEMQSKRRDDQDLVVLYFDLVMPWTGSGSANETDRNSILAAIAERIQHQINLGSEPAWLARASGSGFFVAMKMDQESGTTALEITSRLRDHIHRPVAIRSGIYPVNSIAGIAFIDQEERDPGASLQNAQLAVSEEVRTGRRDVGTYKPPMRAVAERQSGISRALLQALEQEDCLPHFQPQFNMKTGQIVGIEALARWYHPQLGWIAPAEVIPIAEQNGLIIPLERKIIETACAQVQLLPGDVDLAVNLSVPHMLHGDVAPMIEDCLSSTGLPAERLKVEVAAGRLLNTFDRVHGCLEDLRSLGVTLSLDNFGTPASALSGILQYKWNEVKIDTSLTKILRDGDAGHGLIAMALTMVKTLESTALIEGIETIEQRDMLTAFGCELGQGYLFGGPMAIDDLNALFFSEQPNLARMLM